MSDPDVTITNPVMTAAAFDTAKAAGRAQRAAQKAAMAERPRLNVNSWRFQLASSWGVAVMNMNVDRTVAHVAASVLEKHGGRLGRLPKNVEAALRDQYLAGIRQAAAAPGSYAHEERVTPVPLGDQPHPERN